MTSTRFTFWKAAVAVTFWATWYLSTAQADRLPTAAENEDFHDDGAPPAARVELGRMLFFDKLLSGNLNISCASCHHSLAATGDGLSLPVGEGGRGLGVTREAGSILERVPRNAPPIFNLGAREFTRLFHDGRVESEPTEGGAVFLSPAGPDLPAGLDSVLAVHAMFPVTSATEMAGQPGDNAVADAAARGDLQSVWSEIEFRLQDPSNGYVDLFRDAFPDAIVHAGDIRFIHAANAIAAFEAHAWRFDDAPFDRYLRGDHGALTMEQRRGMKLFYGKARCGSCHSGTFQTDHDFHAIAVPQIGPGKGHGNGSEDFGREGVTLDARDRYRFRTPPLRNVALTAPYGHSGAFDDLEGMVRHHLNAVRSLYRYDRSQATLPGRADLDEIDFAVMDDPALLDEIAEASELEPLRLSHREFDALIGFLHALTDPAALDLRHDVPHSVPSGLPVRD